jgi:transposase, IS6 family
MVWLKKGFGFTSDWTINDQNDLFARLFGIEKVNRA